VGEFEDSALLKAFGQKGFGVFAVPSVIEHEVASAGGARILGRTEEIRERFYAISAERRLKHPAMIALSDAARTRLFG
jgi:LysR family transcriptional activator of nhaA